MQRVGLALLPVVILGVLGSARAAPDRASPPLIVVSLDTLRADHLGAYGDPRGLTPHLDAFAAEATVFTQAYSQSDITLLSHASLFTSRYPSELGPTSGEFLLRPEVPTLASVLDLYGYRTAAFTGGGHLARGTGLENGFQTFEVPAEMGSLWHVAAPSLAWLDREGPSPFLFLHTYDAHAPYLKPAPVGLAWQPGPVSDTALKILRSHIGTEQVFGDWWFDGQFPSSVLDDGALRPWSPEERARVTEAHDTLHAHPVAPADRAAIAAGYDAAVSYLDGLFGWWLSELKTRPIWKDAIVVVLADHGESLGEDGLFGHGLSLRARETHVPLMIRVPGQPGRRVDELVALVDVAPTLLELVGATPPGEARGVSLVPWLRGEVGPSHEVVYAEGMHRLLSAHTREDEVSVEGISADSPFLEDLLQTAALDGPTFADSDASPARKAVLRDELVRWHGALPAGPARNVNPAMVQQMQKNGYWESK